MYAIRYSKRISGFGAVKANTWLLPTQNRQMSTTNTHELLIKQPQKQQHKQQFQPSVNNVSG